MNPVITTSGLTMRFRGCEALREVDMHVDAGTVFALLGENGAGKTTLIRILTGFQKPTRGTARVCQIDPVKHPLQVRRRIGYVSDAPALYDWMSVEEIGWFTASFYDDAFLQRYRESIQRFGVPSDRKIRNLSRGQRAKVALSLALANDPQLLILDEPTSGLDPMVRREFLESMIDRAAVGHTVFLSSHQVSEVERVADVVAILHEGRLRLCSPLAELKRSIVECTISMDDPLLPLPVLPESVDVICQEERGRQRRLVVRGMDAELRDHIAGRPEVLSVHLRDLNLEEIFVACTQGSLFGRLSREHDSEMPHAGGEASDTPAQRNRSVLPADPASVNSGGQDHDDRSDGNIDHAWTGDQT